MAETGLPTSWADVERLSSRQEEWASRQVSRWEAFLDSAVRLIMSQAQNQEALLQALIKFCKVPVTPAALKRLETSKAISHLQRVPGFKVLGAIAHLGPKPTPTDLFVSMLSERYERTVSADELGQAVREATSWTGWPAGEAADSHSGESESGPLRSTAQLPAENPGHAQDEGSDEVSVNPSVNTSVYETELKTVIGINYGNVMKPGGGNGQVRPEAPPSATVIDNDRVDLRTHPNEPESAAQGEVGDARSAVQASVSFPAPVTDKPYAHNFGAGHGSDAESSQGLAGPSPAGAVGRPRSVANDSQLGVAEVEARLDSAYTSAFVTAYFMAQAQVAEPTTQVTWRATERPSWAYTPAYVALVAAIANQVAIPHKSPIGVMLLTTGLPLLAEALPPVSKILKVTSGSLAHLGIPPVTRPGIIPAELVAAVRKQYQEEVGIATLPIAFRKQRSWSARGIRDNWSIPKALHAAIRTVARELRLEESAVANLALRAGVHVFEHRVQALIVPVE